MQYVRNSDGEVNRQEKIGGETRNAQKKNLWTSTTELYDINGNSTWIANGYGILWLI